MAEVGSLSTGLKSDLGNDNNTRLDGSMIEKQRTKALEEFSRPSRKPKVFLISLRAGGVGLNVCLSPRCQPSQLNGMMLCSSLPQTMSSWYAFHALP